MFASYLKKASELVATAASSDYVEQAKEAMKATAEAATKVAGNVQAEFEKTFNDIGCTVISVRPELKVMEFPAEDKIDRLAKLLNDKHSQRMMIFNMSEQRYDRSKFDAEVVNVAFRGLPAPPVEMLMELCLSAQCWLAADEGNVLVVHCLKGHSRSAVFLSCFMAFRGLFGHPVDALHEVCQCLNISDKQDILPSQRRYLMYFQQCLQGFTPPRGRLKLLRLQLNGVPKFESEGNIAFRPVLDILTGGELVYCSFPMKEGDASSLPTGFNANDTCASFALPADLLVSGDVLVRIRHVFLDGQKETALRLAFHTGFVPDGFQLARHELDNAYNDPRFSANSFLDLIFDRESEDASLDLENLEPPAVYAKAREVSKRLAAEEQRRRETSAASASPERSPGQGGSGDNDEFAEFEAMLSRGPATSGGGAKATVAAGTGGYPSAAGAAPVPEPGPVFRGSEPAAEAEAPAAAAAADAKPAEAAPSAPQVSPAPEAPKAPEAAAEAPSTQEVSKAAPVAKVEAAPKPTTEAAPKAAEAPKPAATEAARKSADDEMNELFDEFDAALATFGGDEGPDAAPAAPAAAKSAAAAPAAKAAPSAAEPEASAKAAPKAAAAPAKKEDKDAAPAKKEDKDADDVFGDMDAFLKELDST